MDKIEVLLIINSILLSLLALLFGVVTYFLKDLHKEFKKLIEKVNELYSDLHIHITLFDKISSLFEKRIDNLEQRVEDLEDKKEGGNNV